MRHTKDRNCCRMIQYIISKKIGLLLVAEILHTMFNSKLILRIWRLNFKMLIYFKTFTKYPPDVILITIFTENPMEGFEYRLEIILITKNTKFSFM